jgi:aspartate kinase
MSSTIVAEALKQAGVETVWLNACDFLITDDQYTRARPLFEITNPKIIEKVQPCLRAGQVPVTQGFIGSTRHRVPTTLGFEGSDYTAAILGAALDAENIQIWTDVDGIMTADPAVLPEARTVRVISYAEAEELTHLGAKVLHPSTLFPAHAKGIPLHIRNSRRPNNPGTKITNEAPPTRTAVKSIAYKRPITLMNLASNGSLPASRFFKRVFEVAEKVQLAFYLAVTSELNVTLVVDPSDSIDAMMLELRREATASLTHDQGMVSLVGERLVDVPGLVPHVFTSLDGIHPRLICQGASPHSLVTVVEKEAVEEALKRLHGTLFRNPDPELFC